MDSELKTKIHQAYRSALEFTKLYYETIDKRKHLISRLYLDTGLLTWNGNGINGHDNIQTFYIGLPSSDHIVTTVNSQPVLDVAVDGKFTILIQVNGTVKYQEHVPKLFSQTFIVTAHDKWKIVSNCFRVMEFGATKNY